MRQLKRFLLTDFAVEQRDRGWYFGPVYDAPKDYRGPYASISSVSLMIARELRQEVERRMTIGHAILKGDEAAPQP